MTLLRILEIKQEKDKKGNNIPLGTILIDGQDISKLYLSELRDRVTTIPQDPVLFKGTLRFNIDPLEKHSDTEIDDLLKRSGLMDILKHDSDKPLREFKIEEKGDNLSDGEKQIICICRAALRKAKVVIFDEATANIDVVSE